MKNQDFDSKLQGPCTRQMSDAVTAAARARGIKRAEFIRQAVQAALDAGAKTTHRASFAVGNNEFVNEQPDGTLYSTERGCTVTAPIFQYAVDQHTREGYHGDCVICQDTQKRTEKRALASGKTINGELVITPADIAADAEEEAENRDLWNMGRGA